MKSYFQKFEYIIIFIILIVIGFIVYKQCISKPVNVASDIAALTKAQADTINYYKDQNNKLHAQIAEVQASAAAIDTYYKPLVDSLAKVLKTKNSQIQSYVRIIDSTSGNFTVLIDTLVKHDTVNTNSNLGFVVETDTAYRINYMDNYLKFAGSFKPNSNVFNGSYKLKDSLTLVSFYKSSGFLGLGAKRYFLDVSSANPNTTITNLKDFNIITETAKRFGIGPAVLLTLQSGKFSVIPGISLQYTLFRF